MCHAQYALCGELLAAIQFCTINSIGTVFNVHPEAKPLKQTIKIQGIRETNASKRPVSR